MSLFDNEALRPILGRARSDEEFRNLLAANPLAALAGYDLTEEQRLLLVLPNFSWVIEDKLAGLARPQSEDSLKLLKSKGVDALVSLTEDPLDPALLEKYQIQAVHLPVPDFTAPSLDQLDQAVHSIDAFLDQGQKVGVHCGAGLGRTGTVLAAYLVSKGASAREAIGQVRAKRPHSIETAEQEAIVVTYRDHLSA